MHLNFKAKLFTEQERKAVRESMTAFDRFRPFDTAEGATLEDLYLKRILGPGNKSLWDRACSRCVREMHDIFQELIRIWDHP